MPATRTEAEGQGGGSRGETGGSGPPARARSALMLTSPFLACGYGVSPAAVLWHGRVRSPGLSLARLRQGRIPGCVPPGGAGAPARRARPPRPPAAAASRSAISARTICSASPAARPRRGTSPAPRPAAAPAKCGPLAAAGAGPGGTAPALSSAARAERSANTATLSRARMASRSAWRSRSPIASLPTLVTLWVTRRVSRRGGKAEGDRGARTRPTAAPGRWPRCPAPRRPRRTGRPGSCSGHRRRAGTQRPGRACQVRVQSSVR